MTTEEKIKVIVYTLEYLQTSNGSLPPEFRELVEDIKQEEYNHKYIRCAGEMNDD